MKRAMFILALFVLPTLCICTTTLYSTAPASAQGFSISQRVEFKINPTLSLSLSSNNIYIHNLAPGTASDSNIITVSAGTNVASGLKLYAAVNDGSSNNTSLTSTNGSELASISTTKTTLSDFSDNTWGYSYCVSSCDTASSWKNGNKDSATTGYGGLPAYNTNNVASGILMAESSNNESQPSVQFKVGAKAGSNQPPGSYGNFATFSAVSNVVTTTYTINYLDGSSTLLPSATGTLVDDSDMTLNSTTPTKSGSKFLSWCTEPTSNSSCAGNVYHPGDTYPLANVGGSVTINLYAVWQGPILYDAVASQSKGTQTANDLKTTITAANSGVYEYNSSVFGDSSDASDDYTIYYYRGILDSNLSGTSSTYGSNGDGVNYPNYVLLGDNCWRIVRTTGSGGIKMIYNGKYSSGTTANSCANATTNAQITTQAFGLKGNSSLSSGWNKNINRIGYTFNNTSNIQDSTSALSVSTLFGTNSQTSTNGANSNIKKYLENTWFNSANGISAYESMLEPSAGYCNDRTIYNSNGALQAESANITEPYTSASSGVTQYYFGAYRRNMNTSQTPSLKCATYSSVDRSIVDLYTVSGSSDGNGQLTKPIALLTADEASFAGSGSSSANNGSAYHYNSYLRSGSYFWLLSPGNRDGEGYTRDFVLVTNGFLNTNGANVSIGVRPVISLKHDTTITSGEGTAVSPWVISAP